MKSGPILQLLAVCLSLTACAGSPAVGARIRPLPENVRAACDHPSAFLSAADWELMAGRIGDALIECELKRGAAVAYVDQVAALSGGGETVSSGGKARH